MFMNDENKRHRQAIKIARETTNNQKKKYNSVKYLQRKQFSFMKTSIKVSLKILSLGVKLFKPASRRGCLLFSKVTLNSEQKTPDSSCILFCTSRRKRQLKTSQVDTKLFSFSCQSKQFSRCCIIFSHELTCQILTNQSVKIGRRG